MKRKGGFSLIEMVIVIAIGSILMSIAFSAFGDVQQRTALNQSQRVLQAMYARARALSIESGDPVHFRLNGPADSAAVVRNDSVLEFYLFEEELGIDLYVSGNTAQMCLTPSGTANYSCNSFSSLLYGRLQNTSGDTWSFWLMPAGGLLEQS